MLVTALHQIFQDNAAMKSGKREGDMQCAMIYEEAPVAKLLLPEQWAFCRENGQKPRSLEGKHVHSVSKTPTADRQRRAAPMRDEDA